MPTSRTKRLMFSGAAALGLAAGAAGIAAAATGGQAAPTRVQGTISPDQARAAALLAAPGRAGETELDRESGQAVFSVEVTRTDGKVIDVKVDPSNGTVLTQEDPEAK